MIHDHMHRLLSGLLSFTVTYGLYFKRSLQAASRLVLVLGRRCVHVFGHVGQLSVVASRTVASSIDKLKLTSNT